MRNRGLLVRSWNKPSAHEFHPRLMLLAESADPSQLTSRGRRAIDMVGETKDSNGCCHGWLVALFGDTVELFVSPGLLEF